MVLLACGEGGPSLPDGLYAELHTNKGLIVARLEPERAPVATSSFVGLAEGTIANDAFDPGRPFYDGTIFHRVVPGHVIQAGSPASERAQGPGYTYPNEIHAELSHDHAGALGIANGGPHTNAGQFYVTLGDRSYLDGDYIVFGEVVTGMEVVMAVVQDDVVDSVRIVRVGEGAESFHPDTESFQALVRAAEERVADDEARRRAAEEEWIARHHPEVEGAREEVRSFVLTEPSDARPPSGVLEVRYSGTVLGYRGHLLGYDGPPIVEVPFGSGEDGSPGFQDPPVAFTYEPGVTRTTPGLARVLDEMAPGERRVVVVPAALAYGRGGFYGPNREGEPRFHISPNTMLVYEVEALGGEAS